MCRIIVSFCTYLNDSTFNKSATIYIYFIKSANKIWKIETCQVQLYNCYIDLSPADKVGCTKTASFDLAVEYNKGTLESLPTTPKNDKIFYMLGEGMRVFCLAKYSNGTSLTVNWFEMNTNNRFEIYKVISWSIFKLFPLSFL